VTWIPLIWGECENQASLQQVEVEYGFAWLGRRGGIALCKVPETRPLSYWFVHWFVPCTPAWSLGVSMCGFLIIRQSHTRTRTRTRARTCTLTQTHTHIHTHSQTPGVACGAAASGHYQWNDPTQVAQLLTCMMMSGPALTGFTQVCTCTCTCVYGGMWVYAYVCLCVVSKCDVHTCAYLCVCIHIFIWQFVCEQAHLLPAIRQSGLPFALRSSRSESYAYICTYQRLVLAVPLAGLSSVRVALCVYSCA
jgi:hypothetical protein